ncbi:MAG: hypothetical protein RI894_247 [Bacteroidota bacterium]|jgi:hypothetical protein
MNKFFLLAFSFIVSLSASAQSSTNLPASRKAVPIQFAPSGEPIAPAANASDETNSAYDTAKRAYTELQEAIRAEKARAEAFMATKAQGAAATKPAAAAKPATTTTKLTKQQLFEKYGPLEYGNHTDEMIKE